MSSRIRLLSDLISKQNPSFRTPRSPSPALTRWCEERPSPPTGWFCVACSNPSHLFVLMIQENFPFYFLFIHPRVFPPLISYLHFTRPCIFPFLYPSVKIGGTILRRTICRYRNFSFFSPHRKLTFRVVTFLCVAFVGMIRRKSRPSRFPLPPSITR